MASAGCSESSQTFAKFYNHLILDIVSRTGWLFAESVCQIVTNNKYKKNLKIINIFVKLIDNLIKVTVGTYFTRLFCLKLNK